jgi:hypothetical protein
MQSWGRAPGKAHAQALHQLANVLSGSGLYRNPAGFPKITISMSNAKLEQSSWKCPGLSSTPAGRYSCRVPVSTGIRQVFQKITISAGATGHSACSAFYVMEV